MTPDTSTAAATPQPPVSLSAAAGHDTAAAAHVPRRRGALAVRILVPSLSVLLVVRI